MSEQPPTPDPRSNPKAAAAAAKAYAKANRQWYQKKRWWAAIVVGALIVIGALTGGGDTGGTNKNIPAADTQTSTSDSSSTTTKKPKATQPKKAKSTKGQVLLEDSGHGQKQTQSFTAKGDWDLAYKWGSCGGVDIFQMYIYDGDGVPTGVGANTQKSSGQDVTHQHQGGEHYIEVNTACDWSLKVTSAE